MRRLTGLVALVLTLAACSADKSRVVNEPIDAIQARLTVLPPASDAMDVARSMPGMNVYPQPNDRVFTWRFVDNGMEFCQFVVELSEAGAGKTRVNHRAVEPPGAAAGYRYHCDLARFAGEETLAATLEGRPANRAALQKQFASYVIANPAAMMRAVDQSMEKKIAEDRQRLSACEQDVSSKRCEDESSLQSIRAAERRDRPPLRPGTFSN